MLITNLSDKTYRIVAQILMAVLAIIVVVTFCDYGITWDEELQSDYGLAIYDFYMSGFTNRHYDQIFNLYLYGGMFDGLAAILNHFTPNTIYETRHLLNAFIGLVGLWGTWKLGRLIGGGFVGLISIVLLILTPMYYGHMFNNPKDIPFAAGIIWTLYYMAKTLSAFPKVRWKLMLKLGIVYGLTLGVRVNGIMVFGHWGLALFLLACFSMQKWDRFHIQRTVLALIKTVAPVLLLSYAVMLFCWPWAQEAPLVNPLRAIKEFSNFPQDVEVMLNGTIFKSTELPWYYVPLYFVVQLPILHLVGMFLGVFTLTEIFVKLNSKGRRATVGLMLLTICFPIAYAMFSRPALYDAVRHFIFILPPLCILIAIVAKKLVHALLEDSAPGPSVLTKGIFCVIGFVLTLAPLYTMIRLHPYEYIYINEMFGGVEGGYGKFELDYWGSSFKEAANDLENYVAYRDPEFREKKFKVAVCGPWSAASVFLPPNFEPVNADLEADYFLSTTRWMCQDMRQGHEIISVDRFGIPFAIVKDVRDFPLP